MNLARLRNRVLQELFGGLWHTTHPDRYRAIIESEAILAEPKIPDVDRWGTAAGADHYPYVRMLGGISLFDFDQFHSDSYGNRYPVSGWAYFVPFHLAWGCAVWIEIDRQQLAARHFISGSELVSKWKTDQAFGHNIMPEIEAAYLRDLPLTAFKRAFLVENTSEELRTLTILT